MKDNISHIQLTRHNKFPTNRLELNDAKTNESQRLRKSQANKFPNILDDDFYAYTFDVGGPKREWGQKRAVRNVKKTYMTWNKFSLSWVPFACYLAFQTSFVKVSHCLCNYFPIIVNLKLLSGEYSANFNNPLKREIALKTNWPYVTWEVPSKSLK